MASEKLTRFNHMLGVCSAAGDFYGAEHLQRVVKREVAPGHVVLRAGRGSECRGT